MKPSPSFSEQIDQIMNNPGFSRPNAKTIFSDSAQKLLDTGVGELAALDIMQGIYGAGTEYPGSYEASIDVHLKLQEQGYTDIDAGEFAYAVLKELEWVRKPSLG